ncbi:hypothetical protein DPMN_123451 [Dreissena polymorpha]|uniref:Uncharacterized protein n=1 Tax=Dreissena polymorpha TaxID=45954 RepID=A0A9D4GUG3_DREPO|nr:hypothetical protein DPMN_123451 [Dreissena polymorpha]
MGNVLPDSGDDHTVVAMSCIVSASLALHFTFQTPKCQSGAYFVWPASMVLMLMDS